MVHVMEHQRVFGSKHGKERYLSAGHRNVCPVMIIEGFERVPIFDEMTIIERLGQCLPTVHHFLL
jgi:hypothetical protein